jgi:hypothetical protein
MHGIVARVGGAVEGGRDESGFSQSELPADTVAGSRVSAASLYVGITGRARRHAFAASYGLLLGSTGDGFHGDWRKHVVDVAHDVTLPVFDHRLFEFEQRLTIGRLQTIASIPAAERFFGGAGETDLVLGHTWRIRGNPVIRSIPSNRLAPAGAGSDRFVSYNSTTAFTIWNKPVVPEELLRNDQFAANLAGALTSAQNVLAIAYQSGDPNFRTISKRLDDLVVLLARIDRAIAVARGTARLPDAAFETCNEALESSQNAARKAAAGRRTAAFGWVKDMLPDGESALAAVLSSCRMDLVARLAAAGVKTLDLESASRELEEFAALINTRMNAIDTNAASRKAAADMRYAQRALAIITREMNISSVSPVFVFDVARVEPDARVPYAGTRYGIGGGIRFTLLSSVSATATYAANVRRRAGEVRGAFLLQVTTRNLLE